MESAPRPLEGVLMQLSDSVARYLVAIHKLSQEEADVCSSHVAKRLGVTKPSVVKTLGILMKKNLLVKEHYGKIYLTARGVLLARRMEQRIQILQARIPKMGFDLEQNEFYEIAFTLMGLLPERVWAEIAPMPEGVFADDGEAGQETQSADADQSLTAL